ncbi:hypothetical protein SASPL_131428 [Salvia splendens]|uniref:Uncharacterized protein n=1 Tax=Salvia splendens TaxID=180675 RepID=A0A8X8ZKL0_SALSN|nr:hypothetical protein SASPL_131428 [Salvia splendens]
MWEREYGALSLILGHSGVGFNSNNDYKIECNDEPWAQIVKADSSAITIGNKSWPYWEDWKSIFGKDRANGVREDDLTQADELLNGDDTSVADESQPNMALYTVEDFFTDDQIDEALNFLATTDVLLVDSDTKSVRSPSSAKKNSHKRKPEDVLESMLDVMVCWSP